MNDGLKQRIIGALVLVALGIIFIPVLFDRERIAPVDRVTQIPPEPEKKMLSLPEPPVAPRTPDAELKKEIDGRFDIEKEDAAKQREQAQETEATPTTTPKATPKVGSTENTEKKVEKLGAWVLQVASYESKQRASETLKELEKMDFRGFTRETETSVGKRTRLYVGPNVSKDELEKAKSVIDKKFRVDSLILKFRP